MCSGAGSGDQTQEMQEKLGGLSESQMGLNEATQRMLKQLQGKGRLGRSDEQRLQQMAAQQEMIRKRFSEFRKLPPEEQERIRSRYRWFRTLPPEQREVIREKWHRMTPDERKNMRERLQTMTPEERKKFLLQ